jgi:glutamyl-tRNA synthetase
MILGGDGAKLSKRHGALGVDAYRELGYLPEALRNYLLRLGWSHGDDEIISTDQAIEWFDLDAVGRAPARFDFAKLDNLNGHYIRAAEDERLVALVAPRLEKLVGKPLTDIELGRLREAMPELKLRPKTLTELAANARFLIAPRPIRLDDKAAKLLTPEARRLLADLIDRLRGAEWQPERLEDEIRAFADEKGTKLGSVAQPLRAVLTGSLASPGIFVVMKILGREESLGRIDDAAGSAGD